MNRSYNHIEHFVDTNDKVQNDNKTSSLRIRACRHAGKHDANQLDGKQRHAGFDHYEYDMLKFVIPGWAQWAQCSLDRSSLDFQEYRADLKQDQARHQEIHSHGRGQTC